MTKMSQLSDENENLKKWENGDSFENPYSCMRLRSERVDELENLKARFDWEVAGTSNFDAFWRFFGLNYKDFGEIGETVILVENG